MTFLAEKCPSPFLTKCNLFICGGVLSCSPKAEVSVIGNWYVCLMCWSVNIIYLSSSGNLKNKNLNIVSAPSVNVSYTEGIV